MWNMDYHLAGKALAHAIGAHAGQFRKNGITPYVVHSIGVADITFAHGGDDEQVIAALFHDEVEDCCEVGESKADRAQKIANLWGVEVSMIVWDLTNTSKDDAPELNRAQRKQMDAERLARIPARSQLVKLADILYNVGDLDALEAGFARKFLKEKRNQVDHIVTSWKTDLPNHNRLAEKCYDMIELQLVRLNGDA